MPILETMHICKSFNDRKVLDNINLNLDQNQILCLLGPSGCGKTILLRIIAGLEPADSGKVRFDDQVMDAVQPYRRQFGMMFQEFALFPHKTVFENVAFGLQIQKIVKKDIKARIKKILQTVNLEGFEHRNVNDLSGGERQRVALARSLAPKPRLLMLDEPLGALDRTLKERLLLDMKKILRAVGVTTIWVTHDQTEAFAIADSIAVMINGQIKQVSSPEKLYKKPKHKVVADFLGFQNVLKGKIKEKNIIEIEGGLLISNIGNSSGIDEDVTMLIRPEAARVIAPDTPLNELETRIQGELKFCLFKGHHYQISISTDSGPHLHFYISNETVPPPPGENVQLALNSSAIVIMPNE